MAPTLTTPLGPNDGKPSFGPKKLLFIIYYLLFIIYYLLFIIYYLLFIIYNFYYLHRFPKVMEIITFLFSPVV